MNQSLLSYYRAIEKTSDDMLDAARTGNWDRVIKLESVCILLISQLRNAVTGSALRNLSAEEAADKSRIMQRILMNDAEIRKLAEPCLKDLDHILQDKPKILH